MALESFLTTTVLAGSIVSPTSLVAQAQGPASGEHRNPRVVFDRNGGSHTAVLPFDQRFSLVNAAPAELLSVTVWYDDSRRLPRSECSDLGARTRIRSAIDQAVDSTLAEPQRADARGALNAKLATVPMEVFDEPGRELLRQAFADTIETLPDPAARTALRDMLTARLQSIPIRSLSRARWIRSTRATPSDTFSLAIAPLSAGRDYTFCVMSVEALSATDSTALVGKTAAGVRKGLREHFEVHHGTVELTDATYRAMQQSLRAAVLPTADSIVVPPRSLLASNPPLADVAGAFVHLANAHQNRCSFASLFNTMAVTSAPPSQTADLLTCGARGSVGANQIPLGWAIRELAADPGLRKLSRATGSDRIRAAGAVALTVTSMACDPALPRCAEAETVARGQTPINNPRLPTEGNANIERRTASADLRPWADNLDSTLVLVRELRELASRAEGDRAMQRSLGIVDERELTQTRVRIEQVRTAAASQRMNIRNVMEQLDAMDAAVARLASEVVGRDLKHTGIATTSDASYDTRARWHVGQDIGVIHAFRGVNTRETAPYLGVSVYLRPVNKRGDLPVVLPPRPEVHGTEHRRAYSEVRRRGCVHWCPRRCPARDGRWDTFGGFPAALLQPSGGLHVPLRRGRHSPSATRSPQLRYVVARR